MVDSCCYSWSYWKYCISIIMSIAIEKSYFNLESYYILYDLTVAVTVVGRGET
jgi:hypothetical protein